LVVPPAEPAPLTLELKQFVGLLDTLLAAKVWKDEPVLDLPPVAVV